MSWLHRVRRKFFGVNGEKSGELFPKRGKEGEKGRNSQKPPFPPPLPSRLRRHVPSRPGRAFRPQGSAGRPGGLPGTVPRDAAMGDTRQGGDLSEVRERRRPPGGRPVQGERPPGDGGSFGAGSVLWQGRGTLRGSFIYKCMRRPPGGGYCRAGTARGREGLPAVFRGRGRRKTVK